MPVEYRIDKVAGIVFTRATGELTDKEALEYQRGLWANPDFNPSYRELFDFSEVELFGITPQGLQMLASKSPWGEDARRAFVAHDDHAFGMLRVHRIGLEQRGQNVGVFRAESEAWQWLEKAKVRPGSWDGGPAPPVIPTPVKASVSAKTLSWDDYLSLPDAVRRYQECTLRCGPAFKRQRENISKVIAATQPNTVAVLGAGVMNDVPYEYLLDLQAELHLIDWLPGAPEAGLRHSLISEDRSGEFSCLYCRPGIDVPKDYCLTYCPSANQSLKVCDNFEPTHDAPPQCASFEKGILPATSCEDVTGGYAETFARKVGQTLRGVQSWQKAVKRCLALARKVRGTQGLSLPSRSVDLVTSSMVVSQFEHEPYRFFSQAAARLLGRPAPSDERTLVKAVSRLRDTLIEEQLENHCAEIVRILKPGGHCYMSFELFHEHDAGGSWFLVESTHRALGILGHRFDFDFDILTPTKTADRFSTGETSSLVYSYVLKPRSSEATS